MSKNNSFVKSVNLSRCNSASRDMSPVQERLIALKAELTSQKSVAISSRKLEYNDLDEKCDKLTLTIYDRYDGIEERARAIQEMGSRLQLSLQQAQEITSVFEDRKFKEFKQVQSAISFQIQQHDTLGHRMAEK